MYRGEYHMSQYMVACRMVAEGENLVFSAMDIMCEQRKKAPLQVSPGVRVGEICWLGVCVCVCVCVCMRACCVVCVVCVCVCTCDSGGTWSY